MEDDIQNSHQRADQLAVEIGYVVMAASKLELAMIWLYVRLLRSPVGEMVAAGQTFETLRESCLAIARDATVPEDLPHAIHVALANASAT